MVNETDALQRLSQWLKFYHWNVLQDKINDNNNPVFHVSGESTKKPDLIGISPINFVIAIEVKSGSESLPLRMDSKLIQYFINYNEGKTIYSDEKNNPIKINSFVIGTYYSPEGHLKRNETIRECSKEHYNSYLYGRNPKMEYSESFELIRGSIWSIIKNLGYYKKYKQKDTSIGALLSTVLNGEIKKDPCLFVMKNHPSYSGPNSTWWHQWIKI